MIKRMTKDEFEKQYAEECRTTVEELHKSGLIAISCECELRSCPGWKMVDVEDAKNSKIHQEQAK